MLIGNGNDLYDHGMERLLGTDFVYQDGIFDLTFNNRSGAPVLDRSGNLHVIFVAPTNAQYIECGGARTIGMLKYNRKNTYVQSMAYVGRSVADEFIMRYGSISF